MPYVLVNSAQATEVAWPFQGVTVDSRRGPDSLETDGVRNDLEEKRHAEEESNRQRDTLNRLRSWHDWDQGRRTSLTRFCLSKLRLSKRPACPNEDELISLATYYFPPRVDLKVIVCDFGASRFERSEHSLTVARDRTCITYEWAGITHNRGNLEFKTRVGYCALDVRSNPRSLFSMYLIVQPRPGWYRGSSLRKQKQN